jgi:hypothetical protein
VLYLAGLHLQGGLSAEEFQEIFLHQSHQNTIISVQKDASMRDVVWLTQANYCIIVRTELCSGTTHLNLLYLSGLNTQYQWSLILLLLLSVASVEGPLFNITRVNRLHMGAYLCIASNGVPPTVSKRIMLIVHCTFCYQPLYVSFFRLNHDSFIVY